MQNHGSIEIDRPIDEVYWLTVDHVPEWSIIVAEDSPVLQTPEVVGSTFPTVTIDRGQRMEFDGVITKFNPPHLHAVKMTGKLFDIDAEYTFEDLESRTRVTQSSRVYPKWFLRIIFALFGWMMKKGSCQAQQRELESLKRFCDQDVPSAAGQE